MAAISAREAGAFVKTGFAAYPVILVFGPDEGLVGERAAFMASATAGGDLGNVIRLDGDEVAADPLRLADEANAISMFGGVRAIRVRMGGKSLISAVEPLLSAPPVDARVIIEAGDIKANHALRSLIEKSKVSASVPCYVEDSGDIGRLVDEACAEAGFTLAADARRALVESLGVDRRRSRSELEKLFLYCRGATAIMASDVEAVVTDAAQVAADAAVDAAFLGKIDMVEQEARRVLADGLERGVLLSFALRNAFLLQSIRRDLDKGQNASESIKAHRVNWKREKSIAEQISRWTSQRLDRAVHVIADAVLAIRREPELGDELLIRALWSLSLAAGRR